MESLWWRSFIESFVLYAFFIVFLIQYLTKGHILKNQVKLWGKKEARLYKRHPKAFDFPVLILSALLAIYGFVYFTLPLLKDYPLMQSGNYEVIVGITTSASQRDVKHKRDREMRIEDLETGKEILVTLFTETFERGEYVVVYYLPHFKLGVLVEKVDLSE